MSSSSTESRQESSPWPSLAVLLTISSLVGSDDFQEPVPRSKKTKTVQEVRVAHAEPLIDHYDEAEMQRQSAANPVVMPSEAAAWFSLDEIHQVEMDALPEFFNGRFPSKTPAVYKEYRNFMILLYRQYPATYLTATSKHSRHRLFGSLQTAYRRRCVHNHAGACFS